MRIRLIAAIVFCCVCIPLALYASDCGCKDIRKTEIIFFQQVLAGNRTAMLEMYNKVRSSNSPLCSIYALNFQAQLAYFDGYKDSAKALLARERQLLDESSCSEKTYIYNHRQFGYIAYQDGDYESAIENSIKIADIAFAAKDTAQHVTAILNVTTIINVMGNFDYSLELLRKIEPLVDKKLHRNYYGNISTAFMNTCRSAYEQTKQKKYFDEYANWSIIDLEFNRNTEAIVNRVRTYQNAALVALLKKNYATSLLYADSSLIVGKNMPPFSRSGTYGILAGAYSGLGKHSLAIMYADSALFYGKLVQDPETIIAAYQTQREVYKAAGDYKSAYTALENKMLLQDSTKNIERTAKVRSLELKYNKAKNEQTISDLEQQKEIAALNNRFLIALLAGIALIAGILFVLYRQKALKDKQMILETEQRLQRARINPHFFFNSLGSLQSYALSEQDSMRVSGYLGKYAKIMRQTLESSYNELVTVEQEMDFLRNYLDIETLRQPGRFEYTIEANSDVEIDAVLVPPMMIQPFIENSIEHGFSSMNNGGTVHVQFEAMQDSLRISITDNGSPSSAKSHKDYPSRAMQITRDRLYLLNRQYNSQAVFTLQDNEGSGKRVDITLPLLYEQQTHA